MLGGFPDRKTFVRGRVPIFLEFLAAQQANFAATGSYNARLHQAVY